MCAFSSLKNGSERCKHDPPTGIGVVFRTGVLVPDLTGVCGTESPIVGMGLHSVILNPMSVRSSIFHTLE